MTYKAAYDSVHFYMSELACTVVAKSGIPSDRYHLGKLILHNLRSDPDLVMQIDGATGESETNGSALSRTVRCAVALQKLGVQKGDVMVLLGPNHIHLCIPYYAALYLGVMAAAVDETLKVDELKNTLDITKPKIIFCQSEKSADVDKALQLLNITSTVVTFNESSGRYTLAQLLEDVDGDAVDKFEAADFDPAETPACLLSTSGTTGLPKAAILTHQNMCISLPYVWHRYTKFPYPTKKSLVVSPLQWLSATAQYLFCPVVRVTRLQTSASVTTEHFIHLVNTYRPNFMIVSPVMMHGLLATSDRCDFSCFDLVMCAGSAVPQQLIDTLKALTKHEHVYSIYGSSEVGGLAFHHDYAPPTGSSGAARGLLEYRLVDPYTNEDITEPNVPGELWLRGPSVFKGYYNNPEETAETLTTDGWLKTGDILYRNEYWHFFYVERMKSLLKYRNHQISPTEVEMVIRKHPGVYDVAVTGIPDKECGDLVVACVIRKPGCSPTAQQIKDLVKESLTDSKQLRGGVIFMEEFPLTSSSKINRRKLRDMVLTLDRQ